MLATPALLGAAAGVAFGHAVLPDHWVPLAVVGRTRRYPVARVARLSLLAGVAHVLVSVVLGAVIVAIGLQFRSQLQSAQDAIIGLLLIGTGVGLALLEVTGRGHHHDHAHHRHHDEHSHRHRPADAPPHRHRPADAPPHRHRPADAPPRRRRQPTGRLGALTAVMVPFGAAASPDLTILPVFLAASTAGAAVAVGSLAVFAAVTIGTIVGLTVAATIGGYQISSGWLDRWGNALTAAVLTVIGALVLAGVL